MADVNRLTVNALVLHHAVTPLWSEKSKSWLAQWFSDNGFARGYGSNANNWSGLINPYTGARSYAMAQYAGQRVDGSTPDASDAERAAGYRLVALVADPFGQIAWHAGNWAINRASIGIENLGDYRNYTLRDGDAKVIGDFWRGQDQALNGATTVYGHQEVSTLGTECPARIMEMRNRVIDWVNTAPAPAPTPEPTPTPSVPNVQRYEKITPSTWQFIRDANLWNFDFDSQSKFTVVKSFKTGEKIDIYGRAIYKTGSEYLMTAFSFGSADTTGAPKATTGVNKADLQEVKQSVIEVKEETKTESVAFSVTKVTDATVPKDQEVLKQKGENGVRTIVYSVTYTDGKETARTVKSDTVTTPAKAEIIAVGSYVAPATAPIDPVEGEDAASWLSRVFTILKDFLRLFTYKGKK